jgi:hypothetical protein
MFLPLLRFAPRILPDGACPFFGPALGLITNARTVCAQTGIAVLHASPGLQPVFPRGRWGKYGRGLEGGDRILCEKTRLSHKALKRLG